jgi:hypothetical protein
VQGEIKSALDGIKIIIETIAPWKNTAESLVPSRGAHPVRGGLATNTASGSKLQYTGRHGDPPTRRPEVIIFGIIAYEGPSLPLSALLVLLLQSDTKRYFVMAACSRALLLPLFKLDNDQVENRGIKRC